MTIVNFFYTDNTVSGFSIKGHSSASCKDDVGRLVCSAVSSAAYMAANTVTEIFGDKAEIDIDEALMVFKGQNLSEGAIKVLEGLKLHLTELSCQYSNSIKVYSEV